MLFIRMRVGESSKKLWTYSHASVTSSPELPKSVPPFKKSACAPTCTVASVLERHFTDTMDRQGPDIACSMDEAACKELIAASKEIFAMRGGQKRALPEERVTIDFAFATVVSVVPIKKGETLTKENIWVKRPGTGELPAERYPALLGLRAARDIPADIHLTRDMLEE